MTYRSAYGSRLPSTPQLASVTARLTSSWLLITVVSSSSIVSKSCGADGGRGRGAEHVSLSAADTGVETLTVDLLDLDEQPPELRKLDARKARTVELRSLAGLMVPELADTLGINPRTVEKNCSQLGSGSVLLYRADDLGAMAPARRNPHRTSCDFPVSLCGPRT